MGAALDLETITILGGLPDEIDGPRRALVGERTIDRHPGETTAAFADRVQGEARAAGVKVVILGGLPE